MSKFIQIAKDRGMAACSILHTLSPKETHIFKRIREMHCANKKDRKHECLGKVTIDAKGVILQCTKCGDTRGEFNEKSEAP